MVRSIQQDVRRTAESLNALTASAAPVDGDFSVDAPIADAGADADVDADTDADNDADDDAADHPVYSGEDDPDIDIQSYPPPKNPKDPSSVQTLKACKLPTDGSVWWNEIPLPNQIRAIRRLRLWLGREWTKKRAEKHLDTKLKKYKSEVGRRYNKTENKKRTQVNGPPLLGPRQTLWRDREVAATAEALDDIAEVSLLMLVLRLMGDIDELYAVVNESGVNVDGSNPAGVVIPDEEDVSLLMLKMRLVMDD
jgi:hypothetical protein